MAAAFVPSRGVLPPVGLRSRRHIAAFTMHRPESIAEALALRAGPGASAWLAGGIQLIDRMKQGLTLDHVIRLDGLPGLADITHEGGVLRIGAAARHAALSGPVVADALPDLAALWQGIANPRVRFAGTIGGNVMAGNADHDALPALLALDAEAEIATEAGTGTVPPGDLARLPSVLVTGFTVAAPTTRRLFADRSLRPALTLWLGLTLAAGRVTLLRLARGMANPQPAVTALPVDLPRGELGARAADIAAALTASLPEPMSDGRASAAYRRRMTAVLARRLLVRAGGTA